MKKIKTAKSFMIRLRLLNLSITLARSHPHTLTVLDDLLISHVHIHLSSIQVVIQTIHHLSLLCYHSRQPFKYVSLHIHTHRSPTSSVMWASMSCTACARSCRQSFAITSLVWMANELDPYGQPIAQCLQEVEWRSEVASHRPCPQEWSSSQTTPQTTRFSTGTRQVCPGDQVQNRRIAVFSCPSLEGSRDELPALSENPLLCPSALLLTPLRHLGHILDSVLKRISAFVRISNTFSANDK